MFVSSELFVAGCSMVVKSPYHAAGRIYIALCGELIQPFIVTATHEAYLFDGSQLYDSTQVGLSLGSIISNY